MSAHRSFAFFVLAVAAFSFSSCSSSKDGNSNQPGAQAQKANAQGLFAGDLVSSSGAHAGVINLKVDETSGRASAALGGVVAAELSDLNVISGGREVERTVLVPGLAHGVTLRAAFDGTSWAGSLSTPASKTQYNFTLSRVSAPKEAAEAERLAPEGVYAGKFAYPSGGKRPAQIIVEATDNVGERLLALFTPQTAASVQIVYDGGSKESVTQAVWNSDQRTLMATGPAMTSMGAPQLQCVYDELENLDCVLALGKQSVGKGKFIRQTPKPVKKPTPQPVRPAEPPAVATPQPVAPVVEKPAPVPASQVPQPVQNFGTDRTFLGKATFKDARGSSKTFNVSIAVSLAATDVQGPVAAKLTFRTRESQVGANFRMSVYDSIEKTLHAEQRLSAGALAGSLILSCKDFDFKASPYNFTCDYESSTAGVSGVFVMSGR